MKVDRRRRPRLGDRALIEGDGTWPAQPRWIDGREAVIESGPHGRTRRYWWVRLVAKPSAIATQRSAWRYAERHAVLEHNLGVLVP